MNEDTPTPGRPATEEFNAEQAIKAIVNTATSYGLPSLLLGFRTDKGLITTHLHELSVAQGLNMVIVLFNQLCDVEVQAPNPWHEDSKRHADFIRHQQDVEAMRAEFLTMIRTFNKKQEGKV